MRRLSTSAEALAVVRGRADPGHCLECGCELDKLEDVLCGPCLIEADADEAAMHDNEELALFVGFLSGAMQARHVAAVQLALI